jgi:hypothetical protein
MSTLDIGNIERGIVQDFGVKRVRLPKVEQAQTLQLSVTLSDGAGDVLVRNTADLLVLPASTRDATFKGELAVTMRRDQRRHTYEVTDPFTSQPDLSDLSTSPGAAATPTEVFTPNDVAGVGKARPQGFAGIIQGLGYETARHPTSNTKLLLTDYPNEALLDWVRGGGDMLFLSSGPSPFFWRQGRGGTYGGGWISSFSWLRPDIFPRLKFTNPLTLPFGPIMPTGVILGLPVENPAVQQDFLGGQISGWVHHPAVHAVQFRYGDGRVIMTTHNIREALQDDTADPVAIAMLHDLIDYLASDKCQPTLRFDI